MINIYLKEQIKENFQYEPTSEQEEVLKLLINFLLSPAENEVFILRGYAGTGKTSLVSAIVKTWNKFNKELLLLAPTGRAAKVFSSYAQHVANTIHRVIYRQEGDFLENGNFELGYNRHKETVFFVDEASMIANQDSSLSPFGSGRLLEDLIHFVFSGKKCKLILLGDQAQLPPVGSENSVALNKEFIEGFGLTVHEYDMRQVVRQELESGILWNATQIRYLIAKEDTTHFPQITTKNFSDIKVIDGIEMMDDLATAYSRDGLDETVIVCRSNFAANLYNQGVRNRILFREDELNTGDSLMVVRNNYFWKDSQAGIDFLANGELITIERIKNIYSLYDFKFAEVTISLPNYDKVELDVILLLDTLHTKTASLSQEDYNKLFQHITADYANLKTKKELIDKLKANEHLNALQVKYAYAITCHKAQGGQWKSVFIDHGGIRKENIGSQYYKWLYTAITRATEHVYLINFPKEFEDD